MGRRRVFVVLVLLAAPAVAQQVRLETLLSAPFPSEMAAAPGAGT